MSEERHTERPDSDQSVLRDGDNDRLSDAERRELLVEIKLLERKVERLHDEFAHARQTRHYRAAVGLALVGLVAGSGGLIFPASRTALFTLAVTGLFGAVLTYYLTPEQFIAASVGERIYTATASVRDELVADLALTDVALYVPVKQASSESFAAVRLFVPQHRDYRVPPESSLGSPIVVTDDHRSRGISMRPSGAALISEFERTLSDGLATDPASLAAQLRDGLVEDLELVDSAVVEHADQIESVTINVRDSAYGDVTRFDHPISSFIATGFAEGLEKPIRLETAIADDSNTEYLITCRWSEDAVYEH